MGWPQRYAGAEVLDTEDHRWSVEAPDGGRLKGYHPGVTIEDVIAGAVNRYLALPPDQRDESGQSPVTGALRRLMDRHPEFTRQLAEVVGIGAPEYTTDPVVRDMPAKTPPLVPDVLPAMDGLPPAPAEFIPGYQPGGSNG
jgi:hypothetical protein